MDRFLQYSSIHDHSDNHTDCTSRLKNILAVSFTPPQSPR